MGLEVVFGVAALAVGVISGANQMNAAAKVKKETKKATKQEKKAAAARKEANRVQLATQKINALEDRRQRVREERVRRAALLQASENTSGGGSSGEIGATSAMAANLGTLVAGSRSNTAGITGINKYNQKAINHDVNSRAIMANASADMAEADAFSSFLNIFSTGLRGLG